MAGSRRPTVPEAPTGGHGEAPVAPEATGAAQTPPPTPERPPLPREKTALSGVLEEKTVLLYGEAGIGKSTLASEWAGGRNLFFDAAGELADLEVYRSPITDWREFRLTCADYATEMTKPEPFYTGSVLDTADMLGTFCAQFVRGRLGIAHESDADWGKGWSMVREEFTSRLAKLSALPGGVVLISHAKSVEIKQRNQAYDKQVPTLTGGVRDACVNSADLVLFIDYDEDGENRVIYTKPNKYHEAKERGQKPRLPEQISWPAGQSGWETLRAAWYGG